MGKRGGIGNLERYDENPGWVAEGGGGNPILLNQS